MGRRTAAAGDSAPAGDAPPIFFLRHQKENAPRPVEKKTCSAGRPAQAGEGWQSLAAVRDGNALPLGKPPARGGTGIPPCPSPRCRSRSREEPGSAWRSGRRGKRSWSNASLHPDAVGTIRHGTAVTTSQKMIACPKASPNRRLYRYADPVSTEARMRRRAPKAAFSFGPGAARFLFGKTEKKMGGALPSHPHG